MFRVYAPNARIVSVIGDFNNWDSRVHVMNRIDAQGVYEIYIDKVYEWAKYRYVIVTSDGRTLYKSDPYAYDSCIRGINPKHSSKGIAIFIFYKMRTE